jgi:hypothetical protein
MKAAGWYAVGMAMTSVIKQNDVQYTEQNDESCRFNADNDDWLLRSELERTACMYF